VTSPTQGAKTLGSVKLSSRAAPGASEVTYQWRRSLSDAWVVIPPIDVSNGGTGIVSWPVSFSSGSGDSIPPDLVWNLAHTLGDVDGPVQVRVCFDVGGCSTIPVDVTLDENAYGDAYATTEFGPGTLSLLTGNLAIEETDASVPATNTTLTVGRTFNTRGFTKPASGMFGPGWQASLPVDADLRQVRAVGEHLGDAGVGKVVMGQEVGVDRGRGS
jgi:hypothetical protein